MNKLEYDDIQGFVFSGYAQRMRAASYHVLRVVDAPKAKAWLGTLVERVTRSVPRDRLRSTPTPPFCLNVGFSRSGLEAFGLSPNHDIVTFERAFQEGMVSERRTRILGDNGSSASELWIWGNHQTPVDVFLALFTPTSEDMNERVSGDRAYESGGLTSVAPPIHATTAADPGIAFPREHFGFADGMSQPIIREHADAAGRRSTPSLRKFILGCERVEKITEVPSRFAIPPTNDACRPMRHE